MARLTLARGCTCAWCHTARAQSAPLVLNKPTRTDPRGLTLSRWVASCAMSLRSGSRTAIRPSHAKPFRGCTPFRCASSSAVAQAGVTHGRSVIRKQMTSTKAVRDGDFTGCFSLPRRATSAPAGTAETLVCYRTGSSRPAIGDCTIQAHCIGVRCSQRGTAARPRSTRRRTTLNRCRDLSDSRWP